MRKKIVYIVIFFSGLQNACERPQKQASAPYLNAPTVVEANGYVVPPDSMLPPENVPLRNVKSIPAGKPTVVTLHSNVYPAGKPRTLDVTIKKYTPGQDSFSLPKIVPAIDKPFTPGLPEVIIAKDPETRDNNPASFSSFNKLQGLKNEDISSITQDDVGNLWIGTRGGGVTKYNGRTFTNYSVAQGLSSEWVHCVLEDKGGNIWIGTFGGGVTKYDGLVFTTYTLQEGLGDNAVWSMMEDNSGNVWFGTNGAGAIKYNGNSFTHYTPAQGIIRGTIHSITEDSRGNIWFGADNGVGKFDGKSFTNYIMWGGLDIVWVRSIVEDSKGNFWFGTPAGLGKFNGETFTLYTTAEGLSSNAVNHIFEDHNGDLWICTDLGVNKYDGKSFVHFGLEQGLSNERVYSIFKDKSGSLWFGTGNGICKYNGSLFTHITAAGNQNLRIHEDKDGNLWIGDFGGGVSKYDGKTISTYTTDQGLSSNDISYILQDKRGDLWIATMFGGVNKFDGKFFTHYTRDQGLDHWIHYIMEDKKGNLWFSMGFGVSKYDGTSFTQYTPAQGLSYGGTWSIFEDKKGNLWFGTMGGGVSKYDGKTFTHFGESQGLGNRWVRSILEDKNGDLWFGTGNGVSKYDGKYFTNYTTEQGLSNNIVNSLLQAKDGAIWFGTSNGLSRMMPGKAEVKPPPRTQNGAIPLFKNYLFSDGFLGVGTSRNALIEDRNGNIWAGTDNRITAYHAEGDIPDTIPPQIQLSGISLFNENVNWLNVEKKKDTTLVLGNGVNLHSFRFDGLSKWYSIPNQLELAYDNNYLAFQFIGITTKRPHEIKYQYQLEGLDENWSSITDKSEASYSNLPHGAYSFKIKAVNSEGYWSSEFVYDFTIRPPWWKTWWAYGLYALMFLASVWAFIQYRSRKLRTENLLLEEKVRHRTSQLQTSLQNLKETQDQLVQREKMASLGELTAGIAHEIQNPLNFVNNFSEVNIELLTEMKSELDKGNAAEAKVIANDIIENQQKINHHGTRAGSIVRGMLQHSRSSTGQKELTDINALAEEYSRLAYHGFRAKDKTFNVSLKTNFDSAMTSVNIIPQDIGRVILNLITNAFYAVAEKSKLKEDDLLAGQGPPADLAARNEVQTEPSTFATTAVGASEDKSAKADYEPTVTLSTRAMQDRVEIRVKDNGNGIPKKVLDKIFQPFFTTKPTGQGTGLGLSLSYDIIKAHGGELKVETMEGEGAEFIIQLPLKETI